MLLSNKNPPDFLPFLQTLSPFSRLSQGLENCWANLKTFSRIQDSAARTLNFDMAIENYHITMLPLFCNAMQ